jgi:hypothetical protein
LASEKPDFLVGLGHITHRALRGEVSLNSTDQPRDRVDSALFRLNLSTAAGAACCLRDLLRIRYLFPSAIEEQEAKRLHRILVGELEAALTGDHHLERIANELYSQPCDDDFDAIESLWILYSILLMNHPEMRGLEDERTAEAIFDKVRNKCFEEASDMVKEIHNYLIQCILNDCRFPTPINEPFCNEPSRYYQMLKSYWDLCRKALMDRVNHHIFWSPYPLSKLFVKVQSRLQVCFEGLSSSAVRNKEKIADEIDRLIEALTYWDGDEFDVGGDDICQRVQEIDLWLEKTQIMLGTKLYSITREEEFFLEHAEAAISQYDQHVRKTYKQMLNGVTPSAQKGHDLEVFPTPEGANWEQITIRFKDGHTVSVSAGDVRKVCNYTQMGMVNSKNADFTKQWELLQSFAESNGEIGWRSSHADAKLKKQKQELSKRLRAFFGLDDDPIEWVKGEKVYRCRFRILPEGANDY